MKALGRFLREGPRDVLRRLLKWDDGLPVEAATFIQPTAEVRAFRPWELLEEGIIPVHRAFVVPAVAARFSGCWIGSGGVAQGRWAVVVTRVRSNVAMEIRSIALPAFANLVAFGWFPRDVRYGLQEIWNGSIQSGDLAGIAGQIIASTTAANETRDLELVAPNQPPVSGFPGIYLTHNVANIAFPVFIDALLVPLE